MTLKDVETVYYDLSFGEIHPSHIYVGVDLFDWLRRENQVPFIEAEVIKETVMPPMAAHFVSAERPHHPMFNRFVDWTPWIVDGLRPLIEQMDEVSPNGR